MNEKVKQAKEKLQAKKNALAELKNSKCKSVADVDKKINDLIDILIDKK